MPLSECESLKQPHSQRGDRSLAVAEARFSEGKREYERLKAIIVNFENKSSSATQEQPGQPAEPPWMPASVPDRDEYDALRGAVPDIVRLARYERPAWSRQKRALRESIAIKAAIKCDQSRRAHQSRAR